MVDKFIARINELASLNRAWEEPGARLALVWGRRRTGKTRLLGKFVEGKRSIFYGATQQSSAAELKGFADATRAALRPAGSDLLALGDFPDWTSALDYIGRQAAQEPLVVVLDEFPYLAEAEPALPSIIQRFWDQQGRQSNLMLVICGSAHAVMERLQVERAPLFGRLDLRLQLQPFDYRDAALFMPGLKPADQALAYAVMGGMPSYLSRWRDDLGYRANLGRLFADPASPLVEEGEFVLSGELPEGSGYFRIMHAIATGNRTYGAIKRFADIDIQRQLDRLLRLGLVERETPVTENPSKTRRAAYRIGDNFLNFWFRFIYRSRADIGRGLGTPLVEGVIVPGLSDYMGEPWEQICREFVRRQAAMQQLPCRPTSIGRWWSRDNSVEIDIVGIERKKVVLAGSAKWSRSAGRDELNRLRRAVEALPNRAPETTLALFARDKIRDIAPSEALAFTAEDLYK
ncbi:MAG: ATP-binding protein [Actinomycetota bacterium]